MNRLSGRERILVLATGALALFYVFYQMLLLPKWGELGQLQAKARGLKLELKVAESKVKILEATEAESRQLLARVEAPREARALAALNNISLATSKSGLNLITIKPLPEKEGEGLKYALACAGKYRNLYNFLNELYQSKMLAFVEGMSLTALDKNDPNLNIDLTLTVIPLLSATLEAVGLEKGQLAADPFSRRLALKSRAAGAGGPAEPAVPAEPKLEGVWVDAGMRRAFISGQALKVGEEILGWEVVAIAKESVTLRKGGLTKILRVEEK